MSFRSKVNKAEGSPQAELKKLKTLLQQGENLTSILKENSSVLIAQINSQTLTVQKLYQDLNSHKTELVVAECQTQTTGESTVTKDRTTSKLSDRGRQGRKQADLKEGADDPLKSLLHNNQTVLMTQAKAIQGVVETQIHWLQSLQNDVCPLLSPNSESSSSEPDKKYRAIEDEKNTLAKICKDLEAEKKDLQSQIKQLKYSNDVLCKENSTLKSNLAKLDPTYWRQYAPHKIQVRFQLYCPRKTELTASVMAQLTTMLKHKIDLLGLELFMITCESTSQIIGSLPLVVICLYASRLGTDVLNAMQGVPVNPNVAVLVLHHKDFHALPAQTSDKILTGDEYRNIGTILDMAFLSGKGFYTCNMNDRGLDDLINFIKRHSNL